MPALSGSGRVGVCMRWPLPRQTRWYRRISILSLFPRFLWEQGFFYWHFGVPFPAPSLRELSSEARLRECTTMNGEMLKFLSFRRGDENRPHPSVLASTRLNGKMSNMVPFNLPLKNRNVAGDFHRPYGTLMILVFTIHRTTLPQSRPLGVTAPSEREPGGAGAIQPAARKPQDFGRFSSPLRNSEYFTAQKIPRFLTQERYRVGQGTHV